MNFLELSDYAYPTAIVAAYVTVTLCKLFPRIKAKYYPIIAILTGVLIMIIDGLSSGQIDSKAIVTGAMSGLIAIGSYEVIKHFISKK